MKRIHLLILCLLFSSIALHAQDVIMLRVGDDIQAKVLEINPNEIKYKKFDNLEGPVYSILKADVLMIRFENGTKEVFMESNKSNATDYIIPSIPEANAAEMRLRGRQDAKAFYQGRNTGAGVTAVTTVLLSPLVGLIPVAIATSIKPADDYLDYPDPALMRNMDYNAAYKKQAHKDKKAKVWRSYGISSGFWLFIILAI